MKWKILLVRNYVNRKENNIRDKNKEIEKKDVCCNNYKEALIKNKTIGWKDNDKEYDYLFYFIRKDNTKNKNKENDKNKKLKLEDYKSKWIWIHNNNKENAKSIYRHKEGELYKSNNKMIFKLLWKRIHHYLKKCQIKRRK